LIVLASLVAEGCPQLALQLASYWKSQGFIVTILCLEPQPTDLQKEFEDIDVSIKVLDLGKGLGRFFRLIILSFSLCRTLRPQAVLSFPLGWHTFIAIGARMAGVPRVCAHVGNLPPVWTGLSFIKFLVLVQLGRPFTHRLLCCSEYICKATKRDFYVGSREVISIYNACDLERFAVLPSIASKHEHFRPRLGMVARLEMHKDQPTLIHAIALLRDRGIAVDLWLIGEGSHRPHLEGLISDLHLADRVYLLGSRRDIPNILSQLDLFVFSARADEGFGIALAEAMVSGVPIVATDVGACREVLEGGRYGLLVEPSSPKALAAGISHVLADPKSARKRSDAARERALRDFSVGKMSSAYGLELGIY